LYYPLAFLFYWDQTEFKLKIEWHGLMKKPEKIEMTKEEAKAFVARMERSEFRNEDGPLLAKIAQGYFWLQSSLQKSKININNLRILFGMQKKKKRKNTVETTKPENKETEQPMPEIDATLQKSEEVQASIENVVPIKKIIKGHGRLGIAAYPNANEIKCTHTLKAGDPCPFDCGGKLYPFKPGAVLVIKGQPIADVTRFEIEKLRCNLCLELVSAEVPEEAKTEKYDALFMAENAVSKYWLGVPFYRREKYFAMQGIPLSDATQWDLVERLASPIFPVFNSMKKLAAQGDVSYADDTYLKILSVIKENENKSDKERRGMYTTCILSKVDGHNIYLYFSGIKHAGENIASVFQHRNAELAPVVYMCDALSANVPKSLKVILCNCLSHGYRKFSEIEEYFPAECKIVIDALVKVYTFDDLAVEQKMTPEQRLQYHQMNSQPVLMDLKTWLDKQIDENLVEPNSHLGKSIKYMRKHWDALTRFLTVAGAPLCNNITERALKIAIRVRKNSYFFKTPYSAQIGSMLTSMIVTCIEAGGNPIHYLSELYKNKSAVLTNPSAWYPWNYLENLKESKQAA
jgi:transposase